MITVDGFSKFSKVQRIEWLQNHHNISADLIHELKTFWHHEGELQKTFDEFSENTISNFFMPFGLAPNFIINGKVKTIPMVIEESSVVAAASKAAKFWQKRGGFSCKVLGESKVGQVHLNWPIESTKAQEVFQQYKDELFISTDPLTLNMRNRGGGLLSLELLDFTDKLENFYQIRANFHTCDAMGANFINTVLEFIGKKFTELINNDSELLSSEKNIEVIMAILSNYTPECLVEASVSCSIDELNQGDISGEEFARKFSRAIAITKVDPYRATTHNKGIFNGIDAVVLATGNDFRAVEACGHTYACRNGQYQGLSDVKVTDKTFTFSLKIPLALGTVGGLTKLHPLAKLSLEILGQPSASELMQIAACMGLAQNFAAVRSLVTTGIQKGHMKMHLLNILNSLNATEDQKQKITQHFKDKVVSFTAVRNCLESMKNIQ